MLHNSNLLKKWHWKKGREMIILNKPNFHFAGVFIDKAAFYCMWCMF